MRSSYPYPEHQDYPPIILCALQPMKSPRLFPKKDQQQIKKIATQKSVLETLLKYIHNKFHDQGLKYTLIHKLYECTTQEIQFYVPQLVYIAIKKNCKPIKKLLIYKANNNQALRRLILWNVKAFTVLMKQKDFQIKKIIEEFEENLISSVKSKSKFNHAEKAIAMITTASLILKKMEPTNLKQKLQKFIKRFNTEYLNNLLHTIIIPFRKGEQDTFNSNYIVRIVDEDCSCFPTRKRVPYRIIFQTIDPMELIRLQPSEQFFKQKKVQPDLQRDLFDQVTQNTEQMFGHSKFKSLLATTDNRYPFVVDQEESLKIHQLSKFAKKIQKQEKQVKESKQDINLLKSKLKSSFIMRKNTVMSKDSDNFRKSYAPRGNDFKIQNNQNLKLFQATYIPTLPSSMRKSACHIQSTEDLFLDGQNQKKHRWSSGAESIMKKQEDNIKVVEEQTRWNPACEQSAWGMPWVVKQKKYRNSSFFKHFTSLKLHNVVVKGGDDLRQEIVCMQMIFKMKELIRKAEIDIFIKPYEIIVLSENSGILQFVSNSMSVDAMKKQRENSSISEFFSQVFQTQQKLLAAKQNFIRSLVGSSILTYVLKLKDRHNGNILLDNQGHIIHIDFGFILGMSPGGINFETSPFKMTEEYVDFMNGKNSPDYQFFQELFCEGMRVLREKMDELCLVLQIMMQESDLQCFQNFKIQNFKQRFKPALSHQKFKQYCIGLVDKSCLNNRTAQYDFFQYYTNGIAA